MRIHELSDCMQDEGLAVETELPYHWRTAHGYVCEVEPVAFMWQPCSRFRMLIGETVPNSHELLFPA